MSFIPLKELASWDVTHHCHHPPCGTPGRPGKKKRNLVSLEIANSIRRAVRTGIVPGHTLILRVCTNEKDNLPLCKRKIERPTGSRRLAALHSSTPTFRFFDSESSDVQCCSQSGINTCRSGISTRTYPHEIIVFSSPALLLPAVFLRANLRSHDIADWLIQS